MHASVRFLLSLLLLAWVTPAGAAECRAGNEMLEAYGRGSLSFGRTYGIWLHFAGLDGDVLKAGQESEEVAAHLRSNLSRLTGRFPLPRPYTGDGKHHSAFLFDATFRDEICPGRRITAMCSLVFLKSDQRGTGASHAKVVCQFTIL